MASLSSRAPGVGATDLEMVLKDQLLNHTRMATVRPSRVTMVHVAFRLMSINTVDVRNQQLSRHLVLFFSVHRVDDLTAIRESSVPIRVDSVGRVSLSPPGILVTACEMDVSKFPYDTQICPIDVMSYGYSTREMTLGAQNPDVDLKYFKPNGEWDLQKVWSQTSHIKEHNFSYAKVTFYLQLKRRSMYHGLNMVLPVTVMSLLTPLVFLLPHDSGEKIGYSLTVLLAYVVLLSIVSAGLPTSAKKPSLLGLFTAMVMTMSGLSVVMAIHSLSIFHRPSHYPIPPWQARLSRCILSIAKPKLPKRRTPRVVSPIMEQVAEAKEEKGQKNPCIKEDGIRSTPNAPMTVTSADTEEEMTWQFVARVYDAFSLRLFFFLILSAIAAFFLTVLDLV
ncbi:neuronal acetylcholine receptor subunit beta-3-like [Babylonia areolata]|uniref:neuronal acetylcholine receptor subunit beta-3-like n=1 Tax=Babylonia areolata TaxID=304850 RepID=UPI003FCF1487